MGKFGLLVNEPVYNSFNFMESPLHFVVEYQIMVDLRAIEVQQCRQTPLVFLLHALLVRVCFAHSTSIDLLRY